MHLSFLPGYWEDVRGVAGPPVVGASGLIRRRKRREAAVRLAARV